MARILESLPGSVKTFHDLGDGTFGIESVTDVTATVDRAKSLHNQGIDKTGMGDRHVASIPVPVLDAWARTRGKAYGDVMRDSELMRQFLTDPANADFRVWKGAL